AQMPGLAADEDQEVALALQLDVGHARDVRHEADAADGGRGRNADAVGLVVERDVARYDRVVEHAAGFRHALHRAVELAHYLGPLGVGEVHVVGDGERVGADGGQVAPRLDDGLLGAHDRVGGDVAGGDAASASERLVRRLHGNAA